MSIGDESLGSRGRYVSLTVLSLTILAACTSNTGQRGARTVTDSSNATSPRRLALVVGNAAYPTAPLRNPTNDAQQMRSVLQGMNFEVHGGANLTLRAMKDSLAAFVNGIQKGDVAIFYFAGHGMQLGEANYLLPTDFSLKTLGDVPYESVNAQQVLDDLEAQEPSLALLILDACRDNPFAQDRSFKRGLAYMQAGPGELIAFATAPKSVASDGSGSNGLYTQELLRAMQIPGTELNDVFRRTRHAVHVLSHGAQTPWESVATYEDFYFLPPAQGSPVGAAQPRKVNYNSDTLQIDRASALDTIYANGVGKYRFGASPEEINRALPTPFGTVEWDALQPAGEYKSAEVRYFWVPLSQFVGNAGEGLPYGQLYTQCDSSKTSQSNVVFLFTRTGGLFRVSLRFYPDCANGSEVVRQVASQYGLALKQDGQSSIFEWVGKRVVFAGVADVSLPRVPALEWVARDAPKFAGQDKWFDPR
jgi:hypothetical protein